MRLTLALCRVHIGRQFKKHWQIQGQRVIRDSGAEKELAALGIPVVSIQDVLKEEKKRERVDIIGRHGKPELKEENIPRHNQICYVYRDNIVLLEGLDQAKILTKTVEMQDQFPEINPPQSDQLSEFQELVQRCVLTSHVYNATQERLPKVKDPARPAIVLPRVMGIPVSRSCFLLCSKFFHLSEAIVGKPLGMMSVQDSFFAVPLKKDDDIFQFEITSDFLLMSSRGLSPVADADVVGQASELPLPDLSPIKHTITLEKEMAYKINNVYPVDTNSVYSNVHTAIAYFDKEKVQNLYATPVTEKQILGRSLVHSFTIASAQARRIYGEMTEDLPSPVTIQLIQTDGKMFYFSVFQLNTLNLDGVEGTKNLIWMLPPMSLFDSCCYDKSIPTLTGYNPEVFKMFSAFCANEQQLQK